MSAFDGGLQAVLSNVDPVTSALVVWVLVRLNEVRESVAALQAVDSRLEARVTVLEASAIPRRRKGNSK